MELLFKTECEELSLYNTDKLILKADDKMNGKAKKDIIVLSYKKCIPQIYMI